MIHNFLKISTSLNHCYLPCYETSEGRKAYEDTLNCVKSNFPQYIRELEGIADGAQVPFHKLFLLHMDNIIAYPCRKECEAKPQGCSSICLNEKGQEILGHTEDALSETLNHYYYVAAHIISDKPEGKWKVTEEKFTSLCYAGHLPGYTMGCNHHGLVYSVNTISAKVLRPGKNPRHFITRALLSAENFAKAQEILRDRGCGVGDACSVNMTFLNQEGNRLFHNAELGPADKTDESQLNIFTASPGEYFAHCNKYLRTKLDEADPEMSKSSVCRMEAFDKHGSPKTKKDVIEMLGDTSNSKYPVFRDDPNDLVMTIAVGIFDCVEKTWSLYSDNPKKNDPLVVLPLVLQK
ncbi:unnamed protein product [Acanthoscelides obtectus]|nr:unnamed protein product [Acanthoscelides obtectus]CAK1655407.1 hypothetical protein AOBTE_LOCUS19166 [Acanthoscelides obtectus]